MKLEGTRNDSIHIISSIVGTEAYFSQPSGTVNGNYLVIHDNHAIGGATFIANNSTLNDNVTGWNLSTHAASVSYRDKPDAYPNPATSWVNVSGSAGETLLIFDLTGNLIRTNPLHDGWNAINVETLIPGIYLMQTKGSKNGTATRLIVE